jgi:CubicO group peptidase (beta-lactamase class C family)
MRKGFRFLSIMVIALLITYFLMPSYVQTALIYQMPGIEDHKIFENRVVENGDPEPWKQHKKYNSYKLSKDERDVLEKYGSVAYVIIKDGQILFEEYWDGFKETSLSNSFSAAKSIVSLLIGIALDEGYIKSLDQKIYEYLPDLNKHGLQDISIADLLSMSSGLNWDEAYSSPFSATTKAYYGKDLIALVNEQESIEEAGKQFNYLSINTQILALIVQKATGRNISQYASEKIWKKIGAENNALWSLDNENGVEKAYCCFYSNARDFARLGQLILNKGNWGNDQIISENYLTMAISPSHWLLDQEGNPLSYYGFQFWIIPYKNWEIPYMRGILGQYIIPIKEKNAVIVRLGHKRAETYTHFHPDDVYKYIEMGLRIINQ